MTCPDVAGVAALVWGHFPDCTPYPIRQALIQSAERRGGSICNPQNGLGIVGAKTAYELLVAVGCDGVSPPNVPQFSGGCNVNASLAFGPTLLHSPVPAPCGDVISKDFDIWVFTDNYPHEYSWELYRDTTLVEAESGFGSRGTLYSKNLCLPYGSYQFVMKDSYGDGRYCMYGNGYYKLFIQEELIKQGAIFTYNETFSFETGSNTCHHKP